MRVHESVHNTSGESHFHDIEVAGSGSGEAASFPSACLPPGSSSARRKLRHDIDWHPAPCRQYIINLDTGVEIPPAMV